VAIDDNVVAGMRAAGFTEEQIDAARGERAPTVEDVCEVWEENWPAFLVFEGLATQWHIEAGMSGALWTGLNYASAEVEIRMQGIKRADRQKVYADVKIMERAALEVLNSK
jgi:hypothetical protein